MLGRHDGVIHFTVGQRRGLKLATGAPLYVVRLDAGGDLRPHDLDHPRGAEEDVLGLEHLAHPARAEALDEPIFAVERLRRVASEEIGHGLQSYRTVAGRRPVGDNDRST